MSYLPNTREAILVSIQVGFWCALLGGPLALAFGYVLGRKQFPGKSLLGTLLLAPMILPPVVVGFVLLKFFSSHGGLGIWLARWGIAIPFSFLGAVISAMVVSLPLYIMSIRSAFDALDPRYEELALTLGLSPRKVFLRVTLPLILPGILAGALLAFARALGEFGATAVLAGNIEGKTRTISLALYTLLDAPDGELHTGGLLAASLGLTFGALLLFDLLSRWQKRRLENA